MKVFGQPAECVDAIVDKLGKDIRLGVPLGIGKPNHFVNALYRRAKADPSLSLTIYTALSLERPKGQSELERRFLEPMVERVFGNYPDLEVEVDRVAGRLPGNVRVREFYFQAGKLLRNGAAQRDYISTNYTYVARDLVDRGVNVLAQQVVRGVVDGAPKLSLSSNPDVSLDIKRALAGRDDVVFVGQTNDELPFMFGEALIDPEELDYLIENPSLNYTLFGPPKLPVSEADFMIGLHASTLVRDGGELQLGIGALSDAIVYALKLRQEDNARYRAALERLGVLARCAEVIDRVGELGRFETGLFAATEMLVDGFMHLYEAGIIKRQVYDDLPIQRLLNEGLISERVTPDTLRCLRRARAVHPVLEEDDFHYLTRFGILRRGLRWRDGQIELPEGTRILPDLDDPSAFDALCDRCLGEQLEGGAVMHAGFFLGPQAFYRWLRELPEQARRRIDMRSITRINQLYGHEALDRLHRRNARFVNTAMIATLLGAVASDQLEDGAVVSGVGGQYNFVAMAHALPDGRSILQVRSTRVQDGQLRSNIVFRYGHTTIARHQRDILITEYGIADLRGRTDEEVVQATLCVADSRFQPELMAAAKAAHKLSPDWEIPAPFRQNLPERYLAPMRALREEGLFPAFPFGTDLTEEEIVLGAALRRLKAKLGSGTQALEVLGEAFGKGAVDDAVLPYLRRMGLSRPSTLKERFYQRLLAAELRHDPRVGG